LQRSETGEVEGRGIYNAKRDINIDRIVAEIPKMKMQLGYLGVNWRRILK
jgi:hypothetical protein